MQNPWLCRACNCDAETDPYMSTAVNLQKGRYPLSEPSWSSGWCGCTAAMMGCDSRSLSKAEASTHIFVPVIHTHTSAVTPDNTPGPVFLLCAGLCLCVCVFVCTCFTKCLMFYKLNELDMHILHTNTIIISKNWQVAFLANSLLMV